MVNNQPEVENSFIVLFDYDSMIYKSVYRICDMQKIRSWFKKGKSKDWMTKEIINLSVNRISNMGDAILLDIEETGINILMSEYFLTRCPRSKRKLAEPTYKANRKKRKNKWANLVRDYLIDEMGEFIIHNEEWEADDLIKDRAIELGKDKVVICSIDKDLKQIEGIHFNYYRPILRNPDGSFQTDRYGKRIQSPCIGLSTVSKNEANNFFWKQMLMGDAGDGIKGIPRIGEKKAEQILFFEKPENYAKVVLGEYKKYYLSEGKKSVKDSWHGENHTREEIDMLLVWWEEKGTKEFKLHLLLLGLGIKHRPQIDIEELEKQLLIKT